MRTVGLLVKLQLFLAHVSQWFQCLPSADNQWRTNKRMTIMRKLWVSFTYTVTYQAKSQLVTEQRSENFVSVSTPEDNRIITVGCWVYLVCKSYCNNCTRNRREPLSNFTTQNGCAILFECTAAGLQHEMQCLIRPFRYIHQGAVRPFRYIHQLLGLFPELSSLTSSICTKRSNCHSDDVQGGELKLCAFSDHRQNKNLAAVNLLINNHLMKCETGNCN